jgi:hypothetical protein
MRCRGALPRGPLFPLGMRPRRPDRAGEASSAWGQSHAASVQPDGLLSATTSATTATLDSTPEDWCGAADFYNFYKPSG